MNLPVRPLARVWLQAEPSSSEEIEEIMQYYNPSLPTTVSLSLNKKFLSSLSDPKGTISYFFERLVFRILAKGARADDPQAPEVPGRRDVMS